MFTRFDGKILPLRSSVPTSATVKDLEELIQKEIVGESDVSQNFMLVYSGKLLSDRRKTLAEYCLGSESLLDVIPRVLGGVQAFLYVQDTEGRECMIGFNRTDLDQVQTIQQLSSILGCALQSDKTAAQALGLERHASFDLMEKAVDELEFLRIPGERVWTFDAYLRGCRSKNMLPGQCPIFVSRASLNHTVAISALLTDSAAISAAQSSDFGLAFSGVAQVSIFVQDVQGRKSELRVQHCQLSAVQTVKEISALINDAFLSNDQILSNLQWSNEVAVLIEESADGVAKELCEDRRWTYMEQAGHLLSDFPLLIARKFEVQNSLGGFCSKACCTNFGHSNFYGQDRQRSPTLMSYLNLAPPQESRKRKLASMVCNGAGLKAIPVQQSQQVPSVNGDAPPDTWNREGAREMGRGGVTDVPSGTGDAPPVTWSSCLWKKEIFLNDLGLNADRMDVLMDDGRSLAMHLLCQKLQDTEEEACLLNTGVEGRLVFINHARKEKVPMYLRVSCGTVKSNCSHRARYAYTAVPTGGRYSDENKGFPIFVLKSCSESHSCCQAKASLEYSSPKQGKVKWTESQVEKAIWCSELGAKFEDIVVEFGVERSDPCFASRVAHLMARVRSSLRKKRENEYSTLCQYLEQQKETGHTAYFAKIENENCADKQKIKRLFWIRATELYFLKKGLANATSIDFMYNLSQGVHGAFGHLCVLGPEKKIIPVAQFLVESENAAAINWIVQHFRQAHKEFQIKYQPSVKTVDF